MKHLQEGHPGNFSPGEVSTYRDDKLLVDKPWKSYRETGEKSEVLWFQYIFTQKITTDTSFSKDERHLANR